MPSKGFNSILFDFDSIVDREISLLKFFYKVYGDSVHMDNFMDIGQIIGVSDDTLKFERMYGKESMFRKLLIKQENKDMYEKLIELFFDRDQKDIFETGCAFITAMITMISAYKKAGNGVIRTAVRCDNQNQVDFLHTIDRDIVAFVSKREDVNMGKYGRFIVGHYSSALEYKLDEPKSILILNFRENYNAEDNTLLNPELVINLGDIHDIRVISAYQEDDFIKG